MKTDAITIKRPHWRLLAGCGLVLIVVAHGLVAWWAAKSGGEIDGWTPWIAGGSLIVFGLYHLVQHVRGKGHGHAYLFGEHAPDRAEVERGPHHGFLVNLGHGFVEIAVIAADPSPRFRLFFFNRHKQGRSVPAKAVIKIETVRPDGSRQTFTFHTKDEYLESEDEVAIPHEFKAVLQVSHGSHTHPPYEVYISEVGTR